jgi:hypothetical protein
LLNALIVSVSGIPWVICAAPPHRFALHRRRRGVMPGQPAEVRRLFR